MIVIDSFSHIIGILRESFNPISAKQGEEEKSRKKKGSETGLAEQALQIEESKEGFVGSLLKIIASNETDVPTRQAAALLFKNFIRKNWNARCFFCMKYI